MREPGASIRLVTSSVSEVPNADKLGRDRATKLNEGTYLAKIGSRRSGTFSHRCADPRSRCGRAGTRNLEHPVATTPPSVDPPFSLFPRGLGVLTKGLEISISPGRPGTCPTALGRIPGFLRVRARIAWFPVLPAAVACGSNCAPPAQTSEGDPPSSGMSPDNLVPLAIGILPRAFLDEIRPELLPP